MQLVGRNPAMILPERDKYVWNLVCESPPGDYPTSTGKRVECGRAGRREIDGKVSAAVVELDAQEIRRNLEYTGVGWLFRPRVGNGSHLIKIDRAHAHGLRTGKIGSERLSATREECCPVGFQPERPIGVVGRMRIPRYRARRLFAGP